MKKVSDILGRLTAQENTYDVILRVLRVGAILAAATPNPIDNIVIAAAIELVQALQAKDPQVTKASLTLLGEVLDSPNPMAAIAAARQVALS